MQTARLPSVIFGALIGASLLGSSPGAIASDKTDAEGLVSKARTTLQTLVADPDFTSFKAALPSAKAVIIFPQVLKAGFVLGGSGGSGVLMARDASAATWSGPAFYTLAAASLGLQAGASSAEMVMVVNSQKALESLYSNKLRLGAEATAALGTKGMEKDKPLDADFVVYSKVKGAIAGVAVDGSVLDVRQKLNAAYYGQGATPIDIVVKRSVSNPNADALKEALTKAAQ